MQYVVDKSTSMCSVDPLPTSFTFDSILNTTRQTLRMRTSAEFWYLPDANFVFVGKRKLRHVWCDVYQTMTTKIYLHGTVVYEVYLLSVRFDLLVGAYNGVTRLTGILETKWQPYHYPWMAGPGCALYLQVEGYAYAIFMYKCTNKIINKIIP